MLAVVCIVNSKKPEKQNVPATDAYSQLSNKSTGTMEKNLPKSLPVLTFSCGTIGINS